MAAVIALHVLILLLLLRLAPAPRRLPTERPGPLTVTLLPEAREAPTPARTASRARRTSGGAPREVPRPAPTPAADSAPPPPAAPSSVWSQVIPLTREEFASADIAKLPAAAGGDGSVAGAGIGPGRDSGSPEERGGGPNGEKLYNADWQRRPTQAELAGYMPASAPRPGWGMIACRTVAGFRVEDCIELGQSPDRSGYARAVRQAAWQFRVRPPRIGGRPLIGAWVRIKIDYTESGVR